MHFLGDGFEFTDESCRVTEKYNSNQSSQPSIPAGLGGLEPLCGFQKKQEKASDSNHWRQNMGTTFLAFI